MLFILTQIMKNTLFFCITFILFVSVSGCATQYGKSYDQSVNVRFTSEPSRLGYYVISILENNKLGSGFDPLDKKDKPLVDVISSRNRITAQENWTKVKPGEYVVLVDCGTYVTRRQVVFEDGLDQILRCAQ